MNSIRFLSFFGAIFGITFSLIMLLIGMSQKWCLNDAVCIPAMLIVVILFVSTILFRMGLRGEDDG